MKWIRRFARDELETEPHSVRFADIYPWSEIAKTPFGASYAVVEPGGRTMLHDHSPAETFVITRGAGRIVIDGESGDVGPGDVVYLPPGSIHDLTNTSPTDDLVFVSVYWAADANRGHVPTPKLVVPSPPSPNGRLHLGHLAGPYIAADVLRRYYRLRGSPATLLCVTDDHQSFVVDRARFDQRPVAEVAAGFVEQIVATLTDANAAPDVVVAASVDPAYAAAVTERVARLHRDGVIFARDSETLYCEPCQLELYDGYVSGHCPHCGGHCFGFACELCNLPNQCIDLLQPICDRCQTVPVRRVTTRLMMPLEPYLPRIAEYHRRTRLAPKLRRLSALWQQLHDFWIPASQVGTWGVATGVAGFEHHIVSPWFEIAIAAGPLRERLQPGADIVHCFGYDNAFLYLVHDPAVSFAADPEAPLPVGLAANEFLLMDNAKMSTSAQQAIDAADILRKAPVDLLRWYLVKVRPDDTQMNANLVQASMFMTMVSMQWQGWLARLGMDLAAETGSLAPEAPNASLAPWSPEHDDFLNQLRTLARRAQRGYDDLALREVAAAVGELVERATSFGLAQRALAGLAVLAAERATALALELAAVRTLAVIVAPIMPAFGAALWTALGEAAAMGWPDDGVAPLAVGQRVDTATLQAKRFFPPVVQL